MLQKAEYNSEKFRDNSISKRLADLSTPGVKDMSAIKPNLECIEEEEKKVEQSYEFKQSRTSAMKTSVNQRYRKSLVANCDNTQVYDKTEVLVLNEFHNNHQKETESDSEENNDDVESL